MKEKHFSTIALKSIGCRTNQEEILSLGSALKSQGYCIVKSAAEAEIIIINTCSVTGGTESKTKRMIKSLARRNPHARILLTGCLAQQLPRELQKTGGVEWVVGNAHKKDIPRILSAQKAGLFHSSVAQDHPPVAVFDNYNPDPDDDWRTRFSVKIQEGCDFGCSYCIVPILRGPSRSISKPDVIGHCMKAVDAGYKEIVFTGTHIGQYSAKKRYGLLNLIDEVLTIKGDFRLRLSSLDPRDCSDELLDRMMTEQRLCNHIHISVQSLNPDILSAMKRSYREYDRFVERIRAFSQQSPHAGIGGDFIAGFPGETEEMFATTLEAVSFIGFNYGHVFRYSKRPGTRAATMENQIPEKEKIVRSDRLRRLLSKKRQEFIQKQLNTVTHTIVVEKEIPVRGITQNYIRVEVSQIHRKRNTWQQVRLINYSSEKNCCEAVCCGEK